MRRIGVFLLAGGLFATGCSGGDGDPRSGGKPGARTASAAPTASAPAATGLRAAMAEVSGEGPAALHFEYGDLAHWRDIGLATDQGPGRDKTWLPVIGYGLGELVRAGRPLTERTGITPYAADHAVSIGVPPDTAVRIDGGVDVEAIKTKLTVLGGRPGKIGDHDGLSLADDHALDPDGPLIDLGLVNQLNKVVVTGSTVAVGSAAAPVSAVLGGERSLVDVSAHAAVADCLGDVVTAVLTVPQGSGAVALYGVGLRRPASPGDTPVNVICVAPRSGAITAVRQALTAELTTAAPTTQGTRYGDHAEEIEHDEVVRGDFTVLRATLALAPGTPASFVHRMLLTRDLEAVADPTAVDSRLPVPTPTP
ncbi:hypothetical protein GCM10010156_27970 [Planobispora rosea]|uniref:Lipoprotein n=1 Tax=Planobispora rosea TaxID=35762 RepID=A0A8J3WDS7_PLARO|nr:hypothetical protein [Planobispora rosea]GGS67431.1 hypothetical protein GCM10010156_27970 [Planobispora rosea]GIH85157.1 hypothetical protein Pro02_35650 [Planobispora rosea]